MKKWTKAAAIILSFALCGTMFSGCRQEMTSEPVDEGKFQLYVGNFNGGYGDAWLYNAKSRFEEKYKDVDFGNGKVGVQVRIDSKDIYSGAIDLRMRSWGQQVILAENINYYKILEKNLAADMTDVVTTPVNYDFITEKTDESFGAGEETIGDIMNPSMREYLDVGGAGSYYGVPFYEASVGIVYDIDLFEEYGFYYAAEGYGDSAGFVQDINGNWIGRNGAVLGNKNDMTFAEAKAAGIELGNGPDGEPGTYDDGMAPTYDDFFALCGRIEARGCEALTWPGNGEIQRYLNYLAYNLWADYEGKAQMELNFSLSGRAETLIDMKSFDPATGSYKVYAENIDNRNGYLLQQQAGKYEAIKFIERLVRNENCYDESVCFADRNQFATETLFIQSALPENKSRAMLIDGSWWQNEARNVFANMAVDYGEEYSAENRRFGMMPLPKANEKKVGEKSTLAFNTATLILINENSTKDPTALKIAKQFVKFLHTHESLYEFNKVTASAKPYSYTLSPEEEKGLTSVALQNFRLHTATDFVFPYSQNEIVKNNHERFSSSGYLVFQSGGNLNEILSTAFYYDKNLTAWDYFESMVKDHGEKFWNATYGNYIR